MESASTTTEDIGDVKETGDSAGVCSNCKSPLSGRYCSSCGQDASHEIVPVRQFFKQGIEDLLSFDFRYPRTLKHLWFPGRVTSHFLAGQRVSYAPPLKFAFNASVILFIVVALTAPESSKVTVNSELSADLGYFAREYALILTIGQLLVLPVWALILHAGFKKTQPLYLSQLVFALHFHTAATLVVIAAVLVLYFLPLTLAAYIVSGLFLWVYGPYLFYALKRVYEPTRLKLLWFGLISLVSYISLLILISSIIAGLTIGLIEAGNP